MEKIKIVFTTTPWSPASWFIRWILPRSRFAIALSSHCLIIADGLAFEALPGGVRCNTLKRAYEGCKIVKEIEYEVPDLPAAYKFLHDQLGKKYDWHAACGLGFASERDWTEDDAWYCYELAAGTLKAGGLDVFQNVSFVTETALLSLK